MRLARVLSLAVPVLLVLTGCPTTSGSDPCLDVTCGAGTCVPTNGQAQCICHTGYVEKPGPKCEPATTADVCNGSSCSAFPGKECQAVNGFPTCTCPANTFEQDGGCLQAGPCAPNPCGSADGGDPNKKVCNEVSGAAVCSCNPGHAPTADGGCDTEKVFDCAQKHDGGFNDDQYEPDECPALARTYDLTTALPEAHTIGPASDADWFKVSAPALHIIDVSLSGTSGYFWIDVYKPDGITQVASQRGFTSNPSVRFQFSGESHLFVRIKGYSSVTTGSYTIVMADVGVDDFTNDHTQALALQPGGNFAGNIQYAGDVDIVKTVVPTGKTYQYTVVTGTPTNIVIDALDPNGTTVRKTMSRTTSSLYSHTSHGGAGGKDIFLKARGNSSAVTGLFDLTITDLGVDDHGDVIHDATVLSVSSSNTQGVLERSGDLDAFKINTTAGHIYRFNCAVGTVSCNIDVRDEAATQIGYQYQGSSPTNVTVKATTAETWYVFVSYSSGTPGTTYTYRLEDLGTTDDHADTTTGATSITVGTAANGNIEASNDRDNFSFSALAGHSYSVSCAATPSSICSQYRILNSAGTQVGSTGYNTTPAAADIATAGTYFVEVRGGSSTGAYTLTVTDMGIDNGNTLSSATALTLGTPQNGILLNSSDTDFYSFPVTAGRIYRANCTSNGSNSYACYGWVLSSSGSYVTQLRAPTTNTQYGLATEATFVASATGTMYVELDYYAAGGYPYQITVTDLGADDHPNTSAGATALAAGGTANGNLQYGGDVDYFAITPQTNRIYTLGCTTTASNICQVELTDQNGVSLGYGAPSTNTQVTFAAGSATSVYVRISGSNTTTATGQYTLSLTDVGVDDHSNSATGATTLTLATATNGNIQYSGDTDYFSYATTSGRIYRATCTSTSSSLCRIRIRDTNGSLVASATSGTSTSVTFASSANGVYTVEIYGLTGATGTYQVTLFDDGADDHPNTATGSTVLTTTANTNGIIQYNGDVDVFTVAATQGTIYTVTCTSTRTSACYIPAVRDPSTVAITSGGPGTSVTVSWRALASGNYTVEVNSWPQPGAGGDSYTLALTTAVDDHGDTASNPTAVTFGTAVNGGLQYGGDVDVFSWTATVGRIYQVTCTSSSSSMCRLTVSDATGGQIGNIVGGGTNVVHSYKAISGGTNTVRVYSSSSTATGSYSVTVTESQDDHGDVIGSATAITAGAASATAALQYGADVDVFSFTATAMKIYQFSCNATGTTPPQICGIRLRNSSNGTVQTVNPASSNNLVYTFSSGGTYYFEVFGNGTAVGSYTYQLQDLGTDDHGNSTTDATGLTVGATPTNGTIEIGSDRDFFSFNASQSTAYRVRCTSSNANLCRFTVRDPSGFTVGLSSYGPSTETVHEFSTTVSGTFSVEVSSSNTSGTYQIQVALEDGNVYTSATALSSGVTYSAYMPSSDTDWFVVTLGAGNHTLTLPGGNAFALYTTLYDSNGVAAGTPITGGAQSITYIGSTTRTFNGAGTFYVRVTPYYTGTYSILVQ